MPCFKPRVLLSRTIWRVSFRVCLFCFASLSEYSYRTCTLYSVRVWLLKKRELLFCLVFSRFFFTYTRVYLLWHNNCLLIFYYSLLHGGVFRSALSFYTPFFVIIYYCYSSAYFIRTSQRNGIHWLALLCATTNASTQFCLCITSNHTHVSNIMLYIRVFVALVTIEKWSWIHRFVEIVWQRKNTELTPTRTFPGLFISFACSRSSSMPAKIYQLCVCECKCKWSKGIIVHEWIFIRLWVACVVRRLKGLRQITIPFFEHIFSLHGEII